MLSGRVGHYLIEDQIGSGGMGVVYRARDTRLHRTVAIKATHADSTQALKRLRKEAKTAAAIDHPYICKVYELLERGDEVLIVMEYVEGQTLTERLESGPLELDEALLLGREASEALEAIHGRGIVHRDIKPSNLMLTADHIKVMDFGVVLVERGGEGTLAETTTSLTPDGALVGTPYYMAPEQITGDPVDARSDVYALGVVLYRSLSGKYPFEGRKRQAYLRSVLTDSPIPLGRVAAGVPRELAAVVMRCLDREPDNRYPSAAELGDALEEVSQQLSAESLIDKGLLAAPSRRWKVLAAAGFGVALALALGISWLGLGPAAGPVVTVEENRLVTTWPTAEKQARLSPDGLTLSFVSNRGGAERIWRQPLAGGEPHPVTPESDSRILSHRWSPDSAEIAYATRSLRGDQILLKVIPSNGGDVQRRATLGAWPGDTPEVVRWYDDALYLLVEGKLWRYSSDLTGRQMVSLPELNVATVDICPHQDTVVYTAPGKTSLTVARLDRTDSRMLTPEGAEDRSPRWGPDDELFFLSNRSGSRTAWVLLDPDEPPVQIGSAVNVITDLAVDGETLAVRVLSEQADVWRLDPSSGQQRPLTSGSTSDLWPSQAGSLLVFQRVRPGTAGREDPFDADIYLMEGGSLRPLTAGYLPLLSPFSRHLAFLRRSELRGRHQLWLTDIDSGEERLLTDSLPFLRMRFAPPMDRLPATIAWSEAGLIAGLGAPDSTDASIVRFSTGSDQPAVIMPPGRWSRLSDLHVSPDGRRLSFVAEEGGLLQAMTIPAGGGEVTEVQTESATGGTRLYSPGWLDDRRLVLVRRQGSEQFKNFMEVLVAEVDSDQRDRLFLGEGFGGTAQLRPGGRLFFTAADDGIHNLYELDLAVGEVRKLTANQLAGVTFSAVSVSPQGQVLFTYHAENQDIRILKLSLP